MRDLCSRRRRSSPAALPGPGRQASGAKSAAPSVRRGPESVPLEPISPVRNALRPRRLPTAAALGSRPLRGPGTLGAVPRTVTTSSGPQARPPRPGPHPRDGRTGLPAPVRGLSGASNPIRRGATRPPRLRSPPYLSFSGRRRRRAAGEQAHPAEAESGGRTEDGSLAPPRNLLGQGESCRWNGCRRPLSRTPLSDSSRTVAAGNQHSNCHSPPPSPSGPAHPPLLPHPTWPRPACLASWRHAPPFPPPRPAAVTSGIQWFIGSCTFASRCALSMPALSRAAIHSGSGAGDALLVTPTQSL